MRSTYAHFGRTRATGVTAQVVVATWDDHDYVEQFGCAYSMKESTTIFCDFFSEPQVTAPPSAGRYLPSSILSLSVAHADVLLDGRYERTDSRCWGSRNGSGWRMNCEPAEVR